MHMVTAINTDTFELTVLDAETPVLVDVWAPWCGPCRMVEPVVKAVDQKTGREVKVVKVNADDNQDLLYEYGIAGIPTLLFFQHGHLVARMTGVQTEQRILDKLEEIKGMSPEEVAENELVGVMSKKQMRTMGIIFGLIVLVSVVVAVTVAF
jgi:thioredoxin